MFAYLWSVVQELCVSFHHLISMVEHKSEQQFDRIAEIEAVWMNTIFGKEQAVLDQVRDVLANSTDELSRALLAAADARIAAVDARVGSVKQDLAPHY